MRRDESQRAKTIGSKSLGIAMAFLKDLEASEQASWLYRYLTRSMTAAMLTCTIMLMKVTLSRDLEIHLMQSNVLNVTTIVNEIEWPRR
jgi:hypothetical protein